MICKKCGAETADGSKFCGECGAKIETNKKMKQNSLGFAGDVVPPKFDKEEYVSEKKNNKGWLIIGLVCVVAFFSILVFKNSLSTKNNGQSSNVAVNSSNGLSNDDSSSTEDNEQSSNVSEKAIIEFLDIQEDTDCYLLNFKVTNPYSSPIDIFSEKMTINGVIIDDCPTSGVLRCEDNSAMDYMMIDKEAFKDVGITNVSKIEIEFDICDENYNTLEKQSKCFYTELGEDYVQNIDYSGIELLNNDEVRLIYKGETDQFGNGGIKFYIENKTNNSYYYEATVVAINGKESNDDFLVNILESKEKTVDYSYLEGVVSIEILSEIKIEFEYENMTTFDGSKKETIVLTAKDLQYKK